MTARQRRPGAKATVSFILSLLFGLPTAAAQSDESALAKLSRIDQHDASSPCIGDPRTPVCAVETVMACLARQEEPLCKKVGVSWSAVRQSDQETERQRHRVDYVVLSAHPLPQWDDVSGQLTLTGRSSTDRQVYVAERYCLEGGTDCNPLAWDLLYYAVRPSGKGWTVVNWQSVVWEFAP